MSGCKRSTVKLYGPSQKQTELHHLVAVYARGWRAPVHVLRYERVHDFLGKDLSCIQYVMANAQEPCHFTRTHDIFLGTAAGAVIPHAGSESDDLMTTIDKYCGGS
jgi:hypothetical protein